MSHEIISRRRALAQKLQFYYTGTPCVNGHDSRRYAAGGTCVDCARMYSTRGRTPRPPRTHPMARPLPRRHVHVDWSHLTEEQINKWYMWVDSIRIKRGKRWVNTNLIV